LQEVWKNSSVFINIRFINVLLNVSNIID